ncbi:MAG TPA: serine hydrolase, partial [Thermomicrobiales bacterium]|nr:serine hydrolase [Thermomicrobiales bacterium]
GAATARQYLRAGQIDEMELHVVPTILGGGERLFDEIVRPPAGLEFVEVLSSPVVAHFRYARPEPGAQQRAARGRDRRIRAAGNPGSATTQATPAARFDPVRDAMANQVERGVAPGLLFLVAQGSEVHAEAIGMTSFERREPMRRDTIFRITSMTKPITAAAAMMLVEAGKLALDEPVDRLLPELADRRVLKRIDGPLDETVPAKRPITVRDLLTFRLGFGLLFDPSYPIVRAANERGINLVPPDPSVDLTPDEWMRRFATVPLMHQPGERWLYGTGSNVLGVLIGRAAGQPFDAFLRDRIFAPLGMNDTGFSVPADKLDRLATSYSTDPQTGKRAVYDSVVDSRWAKPPAFPAAASGLVSTCDDYLAFARMLLGQGALGARRILSPASVAQMTTNQLTPEQRAAAGPILAANRGWGFGLSVVVDPEAASP